MLKRALVTLVFALITLIALVAVPPVSSPVRDAKRSVAVHAAANAQKKHKRRNVILMISDGIGFNGWLASDYFQHGEAGTQRYQRRLASGQPVAVYGMSHWGLTFVNKEGKPVAHDGSAMPPGAVGAIPQLYDPATRWDSFEGAFRWDFDPVNIAYTSYTDSAQSITAMVTGEKTTNGRLNMSWNAAQRLTTIAESADAAGYSTGAISSVQVSHATPAGVWSHSPTRHAYRAIFDEMAASGLDVIMGAGHPWFDDDGKRRSEPDFKYIGQRAWEQATSKRGLNDFALIQSKEDFAAMASTSTPPRKLLGVAQVASTLQASRSQTSAQANTPSGDPFIQNVPTLADMTGAALNVLGKNERGFFAMIEGGAVDWMNHANHLPRMIEEQIDFDLAVLAAMDWIEQHSSWEETTLIVTSDHDCGSLWAADTFKVAKEGETRFNPDRGDKAVGFTAIQNAGKGVVPAHQYASGYHTNDLVPLWVIGPGASSLQRFAKLDARAGALWGKPYGWDGRYIDTTELYRVMMRALELRMEP